VWKSGSPRVLTSTSIPSPGRGGALPNPFRERGSYPAMGSFVQSFMKETAKRFSRCVLAAR
jgi:hypothetical protein